MSVFVNAMALPAAVLVGVLVLLEVGRRFGRRSKEQDRDGWHAGTGAVETAVFSLLGLLIAFTFSGAMTRFDARRQLVLEEANAIGTAYMRLDLLPPGAQPAIRDLFRQYLDSRLATYAKLPDIEAALAEWRRSTQLQSAIWTQAVAACQQPNAVPASQLLLLPALNQMIDITTTRLMATRTHPPVIVFVMLGVLALASAFLVGFDMAAGKTRSRLHAVGLAAILALTVYVIMDLEYPRFGLIRIDAADKVLIELRESLK